MEPPPVPNNSPSSESNERQWIVILHLSGLAGLLLPSVGNIVGPLIIWLIKRPENPAIDAAGRSVLNFQISWAIWIFLSIVVGAAGSCLLLPLLIPVAVGVAWLILAIVGAFKASNGEAYAFPLTFKFL
jgi:hypothetical protein